MHRFYKIFLFFSSYYSKLSYLYDKIIWKGFSLKFKHIGKNTDIGKAYVFRNPQHIEIGDNFKFGRMVRIDAIDSYQKNCYSPKLIFGDNISIEDFCHIGCINRIEIGNGVLIGSHVLIIDHYHGEISTKNRDMYFRDRPLYSAPILIKDNVWIGDGVRIMPGRTIGNNVIIGANSVVTHDIPDNCVVGGVPARILKKI